MEDRVDFKCQGDNLEEIPGQISEALGITFPKAHTNSNDMAVLSKELRKYTKGSMCIVPFCTTVEAEALGGRIKLGDSKIGPRVESYLFSTIEELKNIKEIDLSRGRIKDVLDCVDRLNKEGETVALNIEGPFTIAASLIDPTVFFRGIRKNRDIVEEFLKIIEDSIVKYAMEGLKRGAKIISYGDPVGALDIVGPKVYEELSGKVTYNILKRLESELEDAIIHLCGKTSTAFEKIGLSESNKVELEGQLTYGEAILRVMKEMKQIKIIGHSCIKRTRNTMIKPSVWVINLK